MERLLAPAASLACLASACRPAGPQLRAVPARQRSQARRDPGSKRAQPVPCAQAQPVARECLDGASQPLQEQAGHLEGLLSTCRSDLPLAEKVRHG